MERQTVLALGFYLFIYFLESATPSGDRTSQQRVHIQVLQRLSVSRLQTVHGVSFFLFRLPDVGEELCFSPPKAEFLPSGRVGMPRSVEEGTRGRDAC